MNEVAEKKPKKVQEEQKRMSSMKDASIYWKGGG